MGKPAILLLERDPTVIEIAHRCLLDEAEVHVVNSVELALRVANRRPIAVAVLEAAMAGAMPSDLIGKLRTQCPGLRVVFLADSSFELDRRYAQLGTQLRKPVTDERLSHAVLSALRLRSMSANVELMRSTSGTYRPLRLPPSSPFGASGGVPPVKSSSAPPPHHIDDDVTEDMAREPLRSEPPREPFRSEPPAKGPSSETRRSLPPSSRGTPSSGSGPPRPR